MAKLCAGRWRAGKAGERPPLTLLIHRNAAGPPWLDAYSQHFAKGEGPMNSNVGMIDRIVRIAIGLLLIAYAIPIGFAPSAWNWVGWIGIVPLATGIMGVCPLYSLLGLSTCPSKRAG
jgi:hypothetical protein